MTIAAAIPVSDAKLLRCADMLEASSCTMHGSAYQLARKGYKIMRLMAQSREMDADDVVTLQKLIPEMRYFSETIARPGRDRLRIAARLIERVLEAHTHQLQ
ncbi:hypothetical protein [Burkholderia cenocepacia]|uniref:hypothetical protein n=1 Tax=Burkholderia cenocepacia TaxID=95486 RepID=UPI000761E581|nr:hypothetical protein [Burkholderia cenocepacia]KWU23412.1 hypothetical protein AS149_37115 [Burkholderia cenocepacia]